MTDQKPKDQKPTESNKPKKSRIVEVVQTYKGYRLDVDGNRTQERHVVEATSELEAELLLEDFFVNKEKKRARERKASAAASAASKTNANANK